MTKSLDYILNLKSFATEIAIVLPKWYMSEAILTSLKWIYIIYNCLFHINSYSQCGVFILYIIFKSCHTKTKVIHAQDNIFWWNLRKHSNLTKVVFVCLILYSGNSKYIAQMIPLATSGTSLAEWYKFVYTNNSFQCKNT